MKNNKIIKDFNSEEIINNSEILSKKINYVIENEKINKEKINFSKKRQKRFYCETQCEKYLNYL